jgi:hypothetical protein
MFQKKWPNRIVSDDGYEVRTVEHGTIVYIEGKKQVRLNSELLSDGGYVIYQDSLDRLKGESNVEEGKVAEILQRVIEAFKFEGTKLNVI